MVFIVSEGAASLLVLLHAAHHHARVGVDDSLASGHSVEVLRDVPCMTLLYIYHLIGTYNSLLNGRLPLLGLVLRGLWLRNVDLLLEHVLLQWLFFLRVLGILGCLRCLRDNMGSLGRVCSFHHDLAALGLAALLALLDLN